MRSTPLTGSVLVAAIMMSACAIDVKVQEVKDSKIEGLPFRMLTGYTVRVYARNKNTKYEQVFVKWLELPNPDKLYTINYTSHFFANSTFELTMRDDNTLASLNTSGESTFPQAIKDIGTQSAAVAAAVAGYENQRRAAQKETLESETALLKAKSAVLDAAEAPTKDREVRIEAAFKALHDAQAAQRGFDSLPEETTIKDSGTAEAGLRMAQLRANQAFRRAGLTEPYPGVFP